MKILHVSCSPRGQAAESYRLSQRIIGFLLQGEPTANIDENYATALGGPQKSSAELSLVGSMSQSEVLIQELENSDCVVIGTPMHNFPCHLP